MEYYYYDGLSCSGDHRSLIVMYTDTQRPGWLARMREEQLRWWASVRSGERERKQWQVFSIYFLTGYYIVVFLAKHWRWSYLPTQNRILPLHLNNPLNYYFNKVMLILPPITMYSCTLTKCTLPGLTLTRREGVPFGGLAYRKANNGPH